jgi:starch-binding outer membrane protein, SusD/RagB family
MKLLKYNTMKYIKSLNRFSIRFSLLAFLLVLGVSACNEDKVLKETPLDFLTPQNAFKTKKGIDQGLAALYYNIRYRFYVGSGDDTEHWRGLGTDVAYHGEDPGGSGYLADYVQVLVPTDSWVATYWQSCYADIQKENNLIDGINKADANIWLSEAEKNAYLGEVKFFRAYSYKILTCLYGDVPLVTDIINTAKTDFTRTPQADILKLMVEDLKFASENLPDPNKVAATGRVNKAAALHFLAEAYLWQKDYQKAVDATSSVINNFGFALMQSRFGNKLGKDIWGSGDVYYDLFSLGNQNLATNTESIWIIQNEATTAGVPTGGGQYGGERVFGPAYFRMGNTPDGKTAIRGDLYAGKYTGYTDSLGRGVAGLRPTNYMAYGLWQGNWNNDIRNAKHNIKRKYYFDNPASAYDKQEIKWSLYPSSANRDAIRDTCEFIFPFWTKAGSPMEHFTNPSTAGGGQTHKDVYAVRLAETLLLRAEAYLGLGNKASAAADINQIRNRAKATPVDAANVTIDYILDERARELYTEEMRRITLTRLGLLVERVRKYCSNPLIPGNNIQDYHKLWPIPQTELDLDLGKKMTQNTGYY